MGIYLNPGNEGFKNIINGIYRDKTGLISVVNSTINTPDKLTCISRPRRFGKSYAAKMLCAYYDKSCSDSKELFSKQEYAISKDDTFEEFLGKYNVIYLDITGFISSEAEIKELVKDIKNKIVTELLDAFSYLTEEMSLIEMLVNVAESDSKFFFIIDEWDALFREHKEEEELLTEYMNFLRELFKNGNVTDKIVAGAYMTGILPIKKYGHQSAISDFREYTMIQPSIFAEYVGFTKSDIDWFTEKYVVNKTKLKQWYDGYSFPKVGDVYNPNSVVQAIRTGVYDTYWSKTETFNALLKYINMDQNNLQADLIQMIGGNEMPVDTSTFQNDMTSIRTRDDVLSLLIHLGYLAYSTTKQTVRIPNEEIRREFLSTIRVGTHDATNRIIMNSDQLIVDTINCDEKAVAKAIQDVHDAGTFGVSPLFYNDEQALRSVVKFAYISCANNYIKTEELPSGHGYADIVYIPKDGSGLPVLLIELKMDGSEEGAIDQIERGNYPKVFENVNNEIILCGINYDSKSKQHACKIKKIKR
ncbi:PD-(D/E)XK nuclease superfamily protein [Pseudobutyrivibrio sp. 49]|uniref:AAA family ATPase n=1 Tax=Pseudobutyrivibrio sp. 49 TaxID=1855344 RepID=UPI0008832206|nr:AAA family ATPase [Pseudobutyrivibrio sp. 49]SDH59614.1 PD-(D/E)XK nuclease superfamily protein [Pseudobutyrivibrio sp. 49]